MEKPTIVAYLKTHCGWSGGVRAVLKKYVPCLHGEGHHPESRLPPGRWSRKSGQPLSPCVEVNGKMIADISGEELENYLLGERLVGENSATVDVPLNAPCTDAQHAAMAAGHAINMR